MSILASTENQIPGDEEAPLRLIRKIGAITGNNIPFIFSRGDKYFISFSYKDIFKIYELEHLNLVFTFKVPFHILLSSSFSDFSFLTDGNRLDCYQRSELKSSMYFSECIIEMIPIESSLIILTSFSIFIVSFPSFVILDQITTGPHKNSRGFHPLNYKNKIIVVHESGHISLWNLNLKKLLYIFSKDLPQNGPHLISQSINEDILAFGWSDGYIQVRNIRLDKILVSFRTYDGLSSLSFRLDGVNQICCGFSSGRLVIYDLETIDNLVFVSLESQVHTSSIIFTQFLPNRSQFISISMNSIKEVNLEGGEFKIVRQRSGIYEGSTYLRFLKKDSEASESILSMSNFPKFNLYVSDLFSDTNSEVSTDGMDLGPCSHICIFDKRDLKWDNIISCHDKFVHSWSTHKLKINREKKLVLSDTILGASISPCGNFFCITTESKEVLVYNLQSFKSISCFIVSEKIKFISFDLTSRGLIWCDITGDIFYSSSFRTKTYHLIGKIDSLVESAIFNEENGLLFIVTHDLVIHVFDVETYKLVRSFSGHEGSISSMEISRDNHWLFTCSNDFTIRIWDITTGTESFKITCPNIPIAISLSPCGLFLASSHCNELGITLWSFDPYLIKGMLLPCKGIHGSNSDDIKVSVDQGFKRWLSIIHLHSMKSRSSPLMPIIKDKKAPFFLSDLAYEELKEKEELTDNRNHKQQNDDFSQLDSMQPLEISARVFQTSSPSKIHSLISSLEKDLHMHEYFLNLIIFMLSNIRGSEYTLDVVVAIVNVYFYLHRKFPFISFPEKLTIIEHLMKEIYKGVELEFQRAIGLISFVNGQIM